MNVQTRRWLLAPLRRRRTYRLMGQHGPALDYATAWALIALRHASGEFDFIEQAARKGSPVGETGLRSDDWTRIGPQERDRRRRWLQHHGRSPIHVSRPQRRFTGARRPSRHGLGPPT